MYDVVDKFSVSSTIYGKLLGKLSLQIIKNTYFVNNAIVEIKLTSISSMWVASFPLQSIENECVSSAVRMYIGTFNIFLERARYETNDSLFRTSYSNFLYLYITFWTFRIYI